MPIRLEYIVSNSKGNELKRFDVKTEAEAYDSVICAAEDISLLIQPLQKKLALTEEQIDTIAEHLAFQSEEVKLALKQIKKTKTPVQSGKESAETLPPETVSLKAKAVVKKTPVVKPK
ncbi:MAG: YebG family protein [Gammaproteobacteria bacterium]|nr:YebG family protein [Gammaproteobacteria bacterium]